MTYHWDAALDARLRALRDVEKLSYREIEARMNRSADTCRTRVHHLKRSAGVRDRSIRKPWSAQDDAIVKAALRELAMALDRTPRAIVWRINRVGLSCGPIEGFRDSEHASAVPGRCV